MSIPNLIRVKTHSDLGKGNSVLGVIAVSIPTSGPRSRVNGVPRHFYNKHILANDVHDLIMSERRNCTEHARLLALSCGESEPNSQERVSRDAGHGNAETSA